MGYQNLSKFFNNIFGWITENFEIFWEPQTLSHQKYDIYLRQKIKNLCLFQLSQTWSASKYLKISQQHIGWIAKNFEKFWELQFSIISLSQNFSKFSVFQQNMLLEKFEILASPWDSWNNHIFLYFFVSNKHFIPVGSMFVVLKTSQSF